MNQEQAQALGALIRQRRLKLGYTTYQVGAAAGVPNSTVVRIEQGKFMAPRPDKLASFAKFLGLTLADVFSRAGYVVPDDLPTFDHYLQAKYPDLPSVAVSELRGLFETLTERHGIDTDSLAFVGEIANETAGGAA